MARHPAGTHHRAEALAAGLPPLLVRAERVAHTVSQGVHGRRRVGQGETFWQFRRYESGDTVSRIDWRQSAKNDPVYIRETEWEAAQSVWLWRDGSPSMRYRSTDALPEKSERADLLLLALASLLIRGGEHVTLLNTGIPPASGRAVLTRLWSLIEGGQAPADSLPRFELLPRYGRVVMIGDFLSPLEDIRLAITAFAHHGVRGHVLQIVDPAEESLPYTGRLEFEGMEGEGDVLIGRVDSIRDAYREEMANHTQALETMVRAAGWSFARHHTDRPPEAALMALYMALSGETAR